MAILKGLSGNPTLTAGNDTQAFSNYGSMAEGGTQTFYSMAGRTAVFEDGTADALTVVVPPTRGSVVARSDGRLSFNLNDDVALDPVSFTYDKDVGGTLERIEATVQLTDPRTRDGWDKGVFYNLEAGPDGGLVIEPIEAARPVHCSPAGKSAADIAAEQGLGSSAAPNVADWIRGAGINAIDPVSGHRYGRTPDSALQQDVAENLYNFSQREYFPINLLYERGQTFASSLVSAATPGSSRLHPKTIGAYGSGARPYFQGTPPTSGKGSCFVVHDLAYGGQMDLRGTYYALADNLLADFAHFNGSQTVQFVAGGSGPVMARGVQLRRFSGFDCVRSYPNEGTGPGAKWGAANGDRTSSFYMQGVIGGMIDEVFVDLTAWQPGYRADRIYTEDGVTFYPKPPEDRSHNFYLASSCGAITIQNSLLTRAAHNAGQARNGATIQNVFMAGANSGLVIGSGWYDANVSRQGPYRGNWAYADYWTVTDAGFKDRYDDNGNPLGIVANGIAMNGNDVSIPFGLMINAGSYETFTGPTDTGDKVTPEGPFGYNQEFSDPSFGPSYTRDGRVASNWNRASFADVGVDGIDAATRDALTIESYTDSLLGSSGNDLNSFATHYRAQAQSETIDVRATVAAANSYFGAPWGVSLFSRSTPQTVTFRPDPTGDTPGIRADILRDWDTGDLPGTVSGDSIDLDGHQVSWNMTPKNPITDLSFGSGGALEMLGGALKPTGTVHVTANGNDLKMIGGAKFDLPGYSGGGRLHVDAIESRFVNKGTVNGNISITAHYGSEIVLSDGSGDFTLSSGEVLEVFGFARAGFDGQGGANAAVTLAAGSELKFATSLRLRVGGIVLAPAIAIGESGPSVTTVQFYQTPKDGTIVTGAVSGATGIVLDTAIANGNDRNSYMFVTMDTLSGTFELGEDLVADCYAAYRYDMGVQTFGTVSGIGYSIGSVREFVTGLHGYDSAGEIRQPDLNTAITLGGTLSVNMSGLVNGGYDLIRADTLSGTFDTLNVVGNDSKDLTFVTAADGVRMIVSDGTGQVEQLTDPGGLGAAGPPALEDTVPEPILPPPPPE